MVPPRRRSEDVDDFEFERPQKSHAPVWIAVGCGVLSVTLCVCVCGGAIGYLLWDYDLTNTSWRGAETLPGFGPLRFEFKKDNVVIMTDAARVVQGTWSRNGANVAITFANCRYDGTIAGNVMSGTARFTDLRFGGARPWTFTVTRD